MRQATTLFLILFSTSVANTAAANEIAFTCNYELGGNVDAARRKLGSATVAIDVSAKTARIDFGKGWFKTMTLQVDGNTVKETAPPASGEQLGFFHFDLSKHEGGFAGESASREFLEACVRTSIDSAAGMPSHPTAEPLAEKSASQMRATEPPAAAPSVNELAAPPPASGQAMTEYYGGKKLSENSAPDSEPPAAAPSVSKSAAPPPASGQATTEYYGGKKLSENSAPDSEPPAAAPSVYYGGKKLSENPAADSRSTMNSTSKSEANVPAAASSAISSAPASAAQAAIEKCHDALSVETHSLKLNFANASFVIEPGSQAELKKIAKIVMDCGDVVVEVGGHTDNSGDPATNKKLSQRRADAVTHILIRDGVNTSNLKSVGYGQEQPSATNATLEGRRLNRRVEFRILGH